MIARTPPHKLFATTTIAPQPQPQPQPPTKSAADRKAAALRARIIDRAAATTFAAQSNDPDNPWPIARTRP